MGLSPLRTRLAISVTLLVLPLVELTSEISKHNSVAHLLHRRESGHEPITKVLYIGTIALNTLAIGLLSFVMLRNPRSPAAAKNPMPSLAW